MKVRQVNADPKRLRILSDDDIEAIYGRPRFTEEERQEHFSLSQPERELLHEPRSIKSRAYFALQLGYFKAKHLFFSFNLHEVPEDLQYVLKRHFDGRTLADTRSVDKFTRIKQQRLIREFEQSERQKFTPEFRCLSIWDLSIPRWML